MTVLIDLVRQIMLIILLTTFLEMIMPSSSMQRFVKVVMGLFILLAILNPMLKLINQQQALEAFVWQQEDRLQFNSVLEQGERLQKVNQDLFWENYQQKLECQMESLIKLVHGVNEAEVQVKFDQTRERDHRELLGEVIVFIERNGEEGGRGLELIKPEQLLQAEIRKLLCQYFGLKEGQINVRFI